LLAVVGDEDKEMVVGGQRDRHATESFVKVLACGGKREVGLPIAVKVGWRRGEARGTVAQHVSVRVVAVGNEQDDMFFGEVIVLPQGGVEEGAVVPIAFVVVHFAAPAADNDCVGIPQRS
jgi:hypothetical protein